MSAPRGVEFDEDELVVGDDAVKVLLGEDEDAFLLGHFVGVDGRRRQAQAQTQKQFHFRAENKIK